MDPYILDILVCVFIWVVFLLIILLNIPVLPRFLSLELFLLSVYLTLADLLVPFTSCTFLFGGFIFVLLGHVGTRSPLLVYTGGLVVDGETSLIFCYAGVTIILVVLVGIILFSWSSTG